MAATLDVEAIRKHFPALNGDQIFMDNAGGSQVEKGVIDAITNYLISSNVQLGASYPVGVSSTATYNAGIASAASYINAPTSSIVLGASTTQLLRNVSQSLTSHIQPGDELILSNLDHEANLASWVSLASSRSATIKWWRPTPPQSEAERRNPRLTADSLRPLLSKRTKIVAVTHTSNILGSIHDIRSFADAVHTEASPEALLCVDAVAFAPHRLVDVQAFGADLYCFSWYKVYGPHVAVLYASDHARARMGSLAHFFKKGRSVEELLGLAGASYELVAAVPAVVRYAASLGGGKGPDGAEGDGEELRAQLTRGFEAVATHEEMLQRIILDYLNSKPHGKDIAIWGEPVPDKVKRVPVISFTVPGWKSKEIVLAAQEKSNGRLGYRWGTFYSVRLAADVLGLSDADDGVVRVSLVHYNSEKEVREWVSTLDEVLKGSPPTHESKEVNGETKASGYVASRQDAS